MEAHLCTLPSLMAIRKPLTTESHSIGNTETGRVLVKGDRRKRPLQGQVLVTPRCIWLQLKGTPTPSTRIKKTPFHLTAFYAFCGHTETARVFVEQRANM